MRTNPLQLPSYKELQIILATELDKKPKQKETFIHCDALISLGEYLSIDMGFFTNSILQNFSDTGVLQKTNDIINHIQTRILEKDAPKTLIDQLYNYLAQQDTVQKSDIGFIFGSQSTWRTQKAIELYNQGIIQHIHISGKAPIYKKTTIIEAHKLYEYALSQSIPPSAITIETKSISIPDNCKRSIDQREKQKKFPSSIILINSPFSQRRGRGHMKKFLPSTVELIRVNSQTSKTYSKEYRYKNPIGVQTILNEYVKLRIGQLLDTI